MGINKVNYGNTTLIDISSDTVTADKLANGYTAHDNTGAAITGTMESASLTNTTATPSNSRQFIVPYTVYGTVSKSGELSPTSMTVSLSSVNLVAGTKYFVTGELTASYSSFTSNYTLCGEWECTTTATSIKYLFDRTPFFNTVTMSSSSLYMSLASSSSSQIGADIDVSLTFYEMNGEYDGYSCVIVEPAPSAGIGTKTVTNSSNTATSLAFSSLSGEPKAFFVRCMAQLTRSSSYSYYYITAIRYNGTNTYGNYWRMSNGTFYADTSHYSFTYSNGTLTVKSSGARGSAGGSFYNGDYELTYIY
jgi:hypothetical protein